MSQTLLQYYLHTFCKVFEKNESFFYVQTLVLDGIGTYEQVFLRLMPIVKSKVFGEISPFCLEISTKCGFTSSKFNQSVVKNEKAPPNGRASYFNIDYY